MCILIISWQFAQQMIAVLSLQGSFFLTPVLCNNIHRQEALFTLLSFYNFNFFNCCLYEIESSDFPLLQERKKQRTQTENGQREVDAALFTLATKRMALLCLQVATTSLSRKSMKEFLFCKG